MSDRLAETYYKETDELATCKERKIEMILDAIYSLREKTVIELLINGKFYGKKINNSEQMDKALTEIMLEANKAANNVRGK